MVFIVNNFPKTKLENPVKYKYAAMWTGFKISQFACWLRNLIIKPQIADKNILIVVGGGPAPGIPNAIRATAATALRNGFKVYASMKGFEGIKNGEVVELTYRDVFNLKHSQHNPIKTSRFNPVEKTEDLDQIEKNLRELRIAAIVNIGGDDTLTTGRAFYERGIRIFSLTKTIDNDVIPKQYIDVTFGLETCSRVAAKDISRLVDDAWTLERWFLVKIMGRSSGSLALESAKKGRAHMCFIPEQYDYEDLNVEGLAADIRSFMAARRALGFNYGVIVLSEGLEKTLLEASKARGEKVLTDSHDNPIEDIAIHRLLAKSFEGRKFHGIGIQPIDISYEKRTAAPSAPDIRITNIEGKTAVRMIMQGKGGFVVSVKNGRALPVPYDADGLFDGIPDPPKAPFGRATKRRVELDSEEYISAMEKFLHNYREPQ